MEDIIAEMTAVMREADVAFETVGGGTRHYVRDVLLPMMEKAGLKIIKDGQTAPGAVWVKASDRLPGLSIRAKWRSIWDAEWEGLTSELLMETPIGAIQRAEWLDESGTAAVGREEIDIDELWDEHSELIDDDIDSLSRWAGSAVISREQFNKVIAKFKQQKEG
ncbi:MAG TPA: hypothetical protein VF008_29140 [Niastella sp.]